MGHSSGLQNCLRKGETQCRVSWGSVKEAPYSHVEATPLWGILQHASEIDRHPRSAAVLSLQIPQKWGSKKQMLKTPNKFNDRTGSLKFHKIDIVSLIKCLLLTTSLMNRFTITSMESPTNFSLHDSSHLKLFSSISSTRDTASSSENPAFMYQKFNTSIEIAIFMSRCTLYVEHGIGSWPTASVRILLGRCCPHCSGQICQVWPHLNFV